MPTFNDNMVDLVYEIGGREIYNDIRSQIQVSETTTIIDKRGDPAEYSTGHAHGRTNVAIPIGSSVEGTLKPYDDRKAISWSSPFATGWWYHEGSGFGYLNTYEGLECKFIEKAESYCKVRITNNTDHDLDGAEFSAEYRYKYKDRGEDTTHEETKYSTLAVRSTDDISIAKYGRRVMDLSWPLGATEAESRSMVDMYCQRYCEPVSRVTMTLVGKTDELKAQILSGKISDMVTIVNTELGLSKDYFINSIEFSDSALTNLPVVTWALEEVRESEAAGYARVGSAIIGEARLGG